MPSNTRCDICYLSYHSFPFLDVGFMARETKHQRTARLRRDFEAHYGDVHDKLQGWQDLCNDVGISIGNSVTQCKKALKNIHINIVDLLQAKKAGRQPIRFATRRALISWTLEDKGRIFPLAAAKKNGFLTSLLENMHL